MQAIHGPWSQTILKTSLCFFASVILHGSAASAATIHVDLGNPNCPGSGSQSDPFCKIQDGINASTNGDTVLVAPGTYYERIDFVGRAITVKSTAGSGVTTINGSGGGSVVTFTNGETLDSVLDGFTITGGTAPYGGGIFCNASPTIINNTIRGNLATDLGGGGGSGGGISCSGAAMIRNNTISGNSASNVHGSSGGGISCGAATIENNTIAGNTLYGTVYGELFTGSGAGISCSGPATISNNIISGNSAYENYYNFNRGGGIACDSGQIITGNVISENSTGLNSVGGGIYCSSPRIANNTITGNQAWRGAGISCSAPTITNTILWGDYAGEIDGSPKITHSDIQGGWSGTGNINADPLFVAGFALASNSPCVDAGRPADKPCGRDVAGNPRLLDGLLTKKLVVDIGAFEFDNVVLAVAGVATPGGTLTIDTSGTAGLDVTLLVGTLPGETCIDPFGALFVNFASWWTLLPWGKIPSTIQVTIPSWISVPVPVVLQQLSLDPITGAGNFSSSVELVIQ